MSNFGTLATVAVGTFAGLWVLENLLHVDIAHQAGKAKAPAAAPAAKGGKAAKGATPAAAAAAPDATAAPAAGGGTWGQNPASKTPCDIPGKPCPTVGALGGTANWCKCIAAAGAAPAPDVTAPGATSGSFQCATCTAGATPGSFTCTNCSGAGAPSSVTATPAATTPAASAASVAYAYAGWAIAR